MQEVQQQWLWSLKSSIQHSTVTPWVFSVTISCEYQFIWWHTTDCTISLSTSGDARSPTTMAVELEIVQWTASRYEWNPRFSPRKTGLKLSSTRELLLDSYYGCVSRMNREQNNYTKQYSVSGVGPQQNANLPNHISIHENDDSEMVKRWCIQRSAWRWAFSTTLFVYSISLEHI